MRLPHYSRIGAYEVARELLKIIAIETRAVGALKQRVFGR